MENLPVISVATSSPQIHLGFLAAQCSKIPILDINGRHVSVVRCIATGFLLWGVWVGYSRWVSATRVSLTRFECIQILKKLN